MKEFNIFRYIKKWRLPIILLCIFGMALTWKYAEYKQSYTAGAVIKYANSEASNGMTPSGDALDPEEVYSNDVITEVLEELGLSCGTDAIRAKCKVEAIVPEDEETRKEAVLDGGDEYEYHPVEYKITFRAGADEGENYAANVLSSILSNYFALYGEKYISQDVLPNNAANVSGASYDYLEAAQILEESADGIYGYLYDKKFHYPSFRSSTTGYTFSDLYDLYTGAIEYSLPSLYAEILGNKATKDADVLLKKCQDSIDSYRIEISSMESKAEELKNLIDGYSTKSKAGVEFHYGNIGGDEDGSTSTDDYILKDVYEDGEGRVNTETTYDRLIDEYVSLQVSIGYARIDMGHEEELMGIFSGAGKEALPEGEAQTIEGLLDGITQELNGYYALVSGTVEDFNEYLGAANITALTGVYVEEAVNVKLYVALAAILFLCCGCGGAVFLGRIGDILEFKSCYDEKTGLPNRASCDREIMRLSGRPLPPGFSCYCLRLDSLQAVNREMGREAGDALLGVFGKALAEASRGRGFAGYNGGGIFLCLFGRDDASEGQMFALELKALADFYSAEAPGGKMRFTISAAHVGGRPAVDIHSLAAEGFAGLAGNSQNKEGV